MGVSDKYRMDCPRTSNSSRNRFLGPIARGLPHPNTQPSKSTPPVAHLQGELVEERSISLLVYPSPPPWRLNQTLQQILQLPHLVVYGERRIRDIQNFHGEQALIVMAGELGDDSAIFDFTLPHAHLELVHRTAAIAQVNVPDIGEDDVVILSLVWPGQEMAGVERQAESIDSIAQIGGDIRRLRQCSDASFDAEN